MSLVVSSECTESMTVHFSSRTALSCCADDDEDYGTMKRDFAVYDDDDEPGGWGVLQEETEEQMKARLVRDEQTRKEEEEVSRAKSHVAVPGVYEHQPDVLINRADLDLLSVPFQMKGHGSHVLAGRGLRLTSDIVLQKMGRVSDF